MTEAERYDAIVIGSGAAGLRAALTLAGRCRVLLLTKTSLTTGGSTAAAQGGIAAALGADDSPELHWFDTVAAGAGHCDPEAVGVLVREGPVQVLELARLGARFDRSGPDTLALGREGAHARSRIVHARGDATGAEILRALAAALEPALARGALVLRERHLASDLVVRNGRCVGVTAQSEHGVPIRYDADAVVIATGGAGRAYLRTTNPPESTGDGIAMAARAGAALLDMEFVQFHPTALDDSSDPLALLSEAIRGEGAVLVDGNGRRFMHAAHPQAELAPRDVVARAIWARLAEGGRVFLDARSCPGAAFPERFPSVYALCMQRGFDPRCDLLPVTPAAHFLMGGIAVDLHGRTSLRGLYACGEAACTRVHGANRLASNSLLESVVFADRTARAIAAGEPAEWPSPPGVTLGAGTAPVTHAQVTERSTDAVVMEVRTVMWNHVGVVRSAEGLRYALDRLAALESQLPESAVEARNVVLVGKLVAEAALARPHSLGAHYRRDDPCGDERREAV